MEEPQNSFKEEPSFSVKYNEYLQDVAGNVLSVNMTQQTYDPVAEELVRRMANKVDEVKISVDKLDKDGYTIELKVDKELANQAHAVPMVSKINGLDPADFPFPPPLTRE